MQLRLARFVVLRDARVHAPPAPDATREVERVREFYPRNRRCIRDLDVDPRALASLSLGLAGALASIVVLWVLPSGLLTGAAAAGGLALMATIGNLGGYVAPYVVGLVREATGRTDYGLYLMAAAMFLGTWLVQLLPRNATIDENYLRRAIMEPNADIPAGWQILGGRGRHGRQDMAVGFCFERQTAPCTRMED